MITPVCETKNKQKQFKQQQKMNEYLLRKIRRKTPAKMERHKRGRIMKKRSKQGLKQISHYYGKE